MQASSVIIRAHGRIPRRPRGVPVPKDDEQIFWGWAADTNRKEYEYWRGLYVRYRLDSEGFERFWQEQNGRCVCGREFAHPTPPPPPQRQQTPRVQPVLLTRGRGGR